MVDAGVAIKAYIKEEYSLEAKAFLTRESLLVPDLFWKEIGSVLLKSARRKLITDRESMTIWNALGEVPLETIASANILKPTFQFSQILGLSMYDSLYFTLAIYQKAVLVTADRQLYENLKASKFPEYVEWIGSHF